MLSEVQRETRYFCTSREKERKKERKRVPLDGSQEIIEDEEMTKGGREREKREREREEEEQKKKKREEE